MSAGLLMTVSMRSALPSLRYCLTRLCLNRKSMWTSVPGVKIAGLVRMLGAGPAAAAVPEHDVDPFGTADVDVVGDERFEERAGPAGIIEHEGLGHLDLAHRQLPPVPGGTISGGERGRDHVDPAVEEPLHVGRSEPVTDRLQRVGVVAGGEPVGQRPVADAGAVGLAFGPLVAVEPHLGRIREVGADLDEPRPELGVEHVEVVDPDAPLGLGELEPDPTAGAGVLGGVEHPLELLGRRRSPPPRTGRHARRRRDRGGRGRACGHPNGCDPASSTPASGSWLVSGERLDVASEPVADLLDDRR